MSDEMFIEGKSYLSSKRAAQVSGYAQDYIGQLARKGLIDAQRIGGLWYVAMESLNGYKEKAASFKPEPPVAREQKKDPSSLVFFDGKEYISASRAAEITGYVQDYVGQLARSGQILARQVGNRWYVEKESIQRHKQEKDGLLAAVQADAVGLQRSHTHDVENPVIDQQQTTNEELTYTYAPDAGDLLPVIKPSDDRNGYTLSHAAAASEDTAQGNFIPIRKPVAQKSPLNTDKNRYSKVSATPQSQQIQLLPLVIGSAATIVIVLSIGYASVLKQNSVYAAASLHVSSMQNLAASVGVVFNKIGDALEPFLAHELVYTRANSQ